MSYCVWALLLLSSICRWVPSSSRRTEGATKVLFIFVCHSPLGYPLNGIWFHFWIIVTVRAATTVDGAGFQDDYHIKLNGLTPTELLQSGERMYVVGQNHHFSVFLPSTFPLNLLIQWNWDRRKSKVWKNHLL